MIHRHRQFFQQITLYHGVTQGDNSKIRNAVFRNERGHGTGKLLFLGHLQAPKDKNSKHLAVLILEFDDVTLKTIYSPYFK